MKHVSDCEQADSRVRIMSSRVIIGLTLGVMVIGQSVTAAQDLNSSQISSEDISALRKQGAEKGWTFTVSANPATEYDLSELTGLVIPENWREDAPFDNPPPMAGGAMADSFDWRDVNGINYCTPIRNQSGCGSCWAFSATEQLESDYFLTYGVLKELSPQQVTSCTTSCVITFEKCCVRR